MRGRHDDIPEDVKALIEQYDLPRNIIPDQQVACVDSTFGFSDQVSRYDVGNEYRLGLGAWARVGQHLHFKTEIQRMADGYLRQLLNVRSAGPIPDYVAVHIRRTGELVVSECSA